MFSKDNFKECENFRREKEFIPHGREILEDHVDYCKINFTKRCQFGDDATQAEGCRCPLNK